ncbi:hypothetical protein CXF72_13345 [Psychromonas sp. MB-3u-54]|nr:hypothetical protein CXF72_13345 [Psychromonas sp. MB-3u-54]
MLFHFSPIDLNMKRFVTLILMLTALIAFTQKVTAFAPLLESEMVSMMNCTMSAGLNEPKMEMSQTDCGGDGMPNSMDCQSYCVTSEIHFIGHDPLVNQPELQLPYQTRISGTPYYLPEPLYRPPFIG